MILSIAKAPPTQNRAHGFVGSSSLDVTMTETNTGVDAEGSIGPASVQLHEKVQGDTVEISGDLNLPRGSADVNVEIATQSNGNKQYRGWVGDAGISLQALHQKDGSDWIVGQVGERNLNVTRTSDEKKNVTFNGTSDGSWGDTAFVNVVVDGGSHDEMVVPLLGISR